MQEFESRILIKLEWESGSFIAAWSGEMSLSNDRIEMGAELASCLGLAKGAEVEVWITAHIMVFIPTYNHFPIYFYRSHLYLVAPSLTLPKFLWSQQVQMIGKY